MFSGGHHHRPLEALKQTLFKLQAIQGSLSQNETAEHQQELEKVSSQFPCVASCQNRCAVYVSEKNG